MNRSQLKILVSGMMGGVPYQGGATWAVLQYILGFKRLGHQVFFVEPIDPSNVHPSGPSLANSSNAAYLAKVARQFGLQDSWALLDERTRETAGIDYAQVAAIAARADVLINISGMLTRPDLLERIPLRVYLDLDPCFNQLWQATQGVDMHMDGHTHFVTVGLAVGQPTCSVPTCGFDWMPTLQPVVLEHWRPAESIAYDALTTVANWRGYGSITANGVFYGQKAHSLRRFMDLPRRTQDQFALALAIHPDETKDLAALHENHWELLDPLRVAGTPDDYREFIRTSRAEFGIAKQGYVISRCGWFSDRSVGYLASGRPVIAQETGFSRYLPTGEGLFAFETTGHVLDSLENLRGDYTRHCLAARELAESYFDSDRVLTRLLDSVGAAP